MRATCILLLLASMTSPLLAAPTTLGWSFPVEELTLAIANAGGPVQALAGDQELDIKTLSTPGDCPPTLMACYRDCYDCPHPDEGCGGFTIASCIEDCNWLWSSGTCPCN